jgi:hypothetical protein
MSMALPPTRFAVQHPSGVSGIEAADAPDQGDYQSVGSLGRELKR